MLACIIERGQKMSGKHNAGSSLQLMFVKVGAPCTLSSRNTGGGLTCLERAPYVASKYFLTLWEARFGFSVSSSLGASGRLLVDGKDLKTVIPAQPTWSQQLQQ